MCLIAVCKESKMSPENIRKAHFTNSDGAGIVWIEGNGKAKWKKNLYPDEVIKLTETLPLPYIIHFRKESKGGRNPLLCHPFIVDIKSPLSLEGEAEKLLMHNGTMHNFEPLLAAAEIEPPPAGEPVSDSRVIAMIVAKHGKWDFLSKIKGNFVLIDSTKEKGRFIIIGDTFSEEDGIFYSNTEWKYKTSYYNNSSINAPVTPVSSPVTHSRSSETMDNDDIWAAQKCGINYSESEFFSVGGAEQDKKKITTAPTDNISSALLNAMTGKEYKRYRKYLRRESGPEDKSKVDNTYSTIRCIHCKENLSKIRVSLLISTRVVDPNKMKCYLCDEAERAKINASLTVNEKKSPDIANIGPTSNKDLAEENGYICY